ncbi:hypothetical protein M3Y99_01251800 [Aphelenchoides fujianensis]|nr:hypothetical protein M3Y99_01251800 [Aphelenchoides fujianensis]
MLSKSNEKFVVKTPPIPFAVAVQRHNKAGCKIKLTGAAKPGRGFGISFNRDDYVVFRLYFDCEFKRLHLCRDNDESLVDSQDCGFNFAQLFKLKVHFEPVLQIKIKNGPSFSVNGITPLLTNVNMICVHGNLVVVKALLQKFVICSDDGGYRTNPAPALPPSPHVPQPQQHAAQPPLGFHHPPQSFPQQQQAVYDSSPMSPNNFLPHMMPAVPPPYSHHLPIYSGVIIEDKDGHNQHILE